MFDIEALLLLLIAKFPVLLGVCAILGLLVVVGQALVAFSPTKKDDAVLQRIMAIPFVGAIVAALVKFAPIQQRDPK